MKYSQNIFSHKSAKLFQLRKFPILRYVAQVYACTHAVFKIAKEVATYWFNPLTACTGKLCTLSFSGLNYHSVILFYKDNFTESQDY